MPGWSNRVTCTLPCVPHELPFSNLVTSCLVSPSAAPELARRAGSLPRSVSPRGIHAGRRGIDCWGKGGCDAGSAGVRFLGLFGGDLTRVKCEVAWRLPFSWTLFLLGDEKCFLGVSTRLLPQCGCLTGGSTVEVAPFPLFWTLLLSWEWRNLLR